MIKLEINSSFSRISSLTNFKILNIYGIQTKIIIPIGYNSV